jgi:uncharacterized glyoxalase superfamily protein PhnB
MNTIESTHAVAPEGWHAVTPRIVVRGAGEFVQFLQVVFEASGEYERGRPSVLRVGDSLVMVSEADVRAPFPAFLYVYVREVDTLFGRAVQAGAAVVEAPFDTPYGDRRCMFEDRWGNAWQVARRDPG